MNKCSICKKEIPQEENFCMDCTRKMFSRSYIIEYCKERISIICLSQQKVDKHKYIEFVGKCPKCGHQNRA